jgi:hypothetical protein
MDIFCIDPDNSRFHKDRYSGQWRQRVPLTVAWHMRNLTPHRKPPDSHTLSAHPSNQTASPPQNPLAFTPHHLYNPHR